MPRMSSRLCAGLLLLLPLAAPPLHAQERLSGEALVTALRQGGFSIYFRHAATEWSHQDRVTEAGDWKSCDPARMRQLSDKGRATARRIGAAMRRLGVPVGRVLSSEYCRSAETARLLGLGAVRTTTDIMNLLAAEHIGGRAAAARRAKRAIGRRPGLGTNTVIVAHGNLMRAATGDYVGEAGAGIYRALGDGRFRKVAILAPDDWLRLADRYPADE